MNFAFSSLSCRESRDSRRDAPCCCLLRSNSGRRAAAVNFCSALKTATAATPSFGDYTSPPPGFRELPPEPDNSMSMLPIIIYAAASIAFLLCVFLRGGHYRIFFLGLVNGAVLAYCYCLRDAPRKAYHRSVTP